jgi:hypothetical protein
LYVRFSKQLIIGELAGFGAGIALAEGSSWLGIDNVGISLYSSAADYGGSILGFLAIVYSDNKKTFRQDSRKSRLKKTIKDALSLWPSVLVGDIAFILSRPYFHYESLSVGLEPGISASLAHLLAFAVFNGFAILSRSIIDYIHNTRTS